MFSAKFYLSNEEKNGYEVENVEHLEDVELDNVTVLIVDVDPNLISMHN